MSPKWGKPGRGACPAGDAAGLVFSSHIQSNFHLRDRPSNLVCQLFSLPSLVTDWVACVNVSFCFSRVEQIIALNSQSLDDLAVVSWVWLRADH